MRSISLAVSTAVTGAVFVLGAPFAHASGEMGPQAPSDACSKATAVAEKAESEYNAMRKDYQKTVDDGGHPDQSQRDALQKAETEMNSTASQAARACPDAQKPSGAAQKPTGAMRTGLGGTSESGNETIAVAGAAAVALTGAGLLAVRRRRSTDRS